MKPIICTILFLFFYQSYSCAQIEDTILARQYLDSLKYYNNDNMRYFNTREDWERAFKFGKTALIIDIKE